LFTQTNLELYICMNNQLSMSPEFERQKNIQASVLTAAITGALLFIFIWVKLTIPHEEARPVEEYIEVALPDLPVEDVNLGNNDVGSGNVQPIVTGTPSSAPVASTAASTPARSESHEQTTKDVQTDDHSDGPPIIKPSKPNPQAKEITTNANPQTVTTPQPKLRDGAQMTSTRGSGNGGNTSAEGYDRPGSQGPGDGPGDKGAYNGNPKGKNFGVQVLSIPNQSFEDDFNQNAKVAIEIETDESGKVISAKYTSKGSSGTATQKMIEKAKRLAYDLKKSGNGKGTVIFNFKVNG
jgi:hypothetical protein